MTNGLLAVFSEPGQVPVAEFHNWYDQEHVPLRLQFPEFANGYRFKAVDGLTPAWLATYDIDLAVLQNPLYQSLREQRSPHEQHIVENLHTLDRRVYSLEHEAGALDGEPRYQVVVGLTSQAEDGLVDWYMHEHIPLLLQIPGWNRIRQYRLIEGAGEQIVTIHDIEHPSVCETESWRGATSTPWRENVMADVTSRSRRVFKFHNAGQRPPANWLNPHLIKETQ
ncbi:hypothetical protein ACTAQI_17285 [Pseudarthrobacter sp. alpha12b]